MARSLTAAALEALQGRVVKPAFFYEGEFSGGTLRLWTGQGDISWNGYTWTGAGNMLQISAAQETQDVRAVAFSVSLSGQLSSTLAVALAQCVQGLSGTVYLGLFAPSAYFSMSGDVDNYASTPDVYVPGDIDIRMKIAADDWTPGLQETLISKFDSVSSPINAEWWLGLQTSGKPAFTISQDGVTYHVHSATVAISGTDGEALHLRVTCALNSGSPPATSCYFYTSSDGLNWTQLGDEVHVDTAFGSIWNSGLSIEIGSFDSGQSQLFRGKVYSAEIRNGIAGPVVAKFDASRFAQYGPTAVAETGEVWTINATGSPAAQIINSGDALVADPYAIFKGRLNTPDIVDRGEDATITVTYESHLIDGAKQRERRYTPEDQKIDYATDAGFDSVTSLQDKQVTWGKS